jgi:hypothetical protein
MMTIAAITIGPMHRINSKSKLMVCFRLFCLWTYYKGTIHKTVSPCLKAIEQAKRIALANHNMRLLFAQK